MPADTTYLLYLHNLQDSVPFEGVEVSFHNKSCISAWKRAQALYKEGHKA